MVGIVVVSHSEALARGVVALAREMDPSGTLAIEPAGGVADAPQALGTDAERVRVAIEAVISPDGVLVLMDLGSALMSAEFAAELVDGGPVVLSDAPLVEGAVAAAASAAGGATLAEVAAEARGALAMKRAQLGGDDADSPASAAPDGGDALTAPLPVLGAAGLHARPAARVVQVAHRHDATVTLALGDRTVDAASLTGVVSLGARQGDTLLARASGPDAAPALAALRALAADRFGDGDEGPPAPARPAAAPTAPPPTDGTLHGIPVGDGIAVGPAWRLRTVAADPRDDPPPGTPAQERAALDAALELARGELAADRSRLAGAAGEAGEIFDAHRALLDDSALLTPARAAIDAGAPAARAWRDAVAAVAAVYAGLPEPLLREREVDVRDVGRRVLSGLGGPPAPGAACSALPAPAGAIVIADELAPADAVAIDPGSVAGIATARGSATAHAAILARALGLPCAVGLGPALLGVADGTELLLDGGAGTLAVAPDGALASEARARQAQLTRRRAAAREQAHEPAITRDGTAVHVLANLADPAEVADAVALGADGIGLLRTEFLYLGRTELPGEREQADALREIATALHGRPLVVRTLDVGADKPLPALPAPPEENPFLGVRGVRRTLAHPAVLDVQLRAILRAAAACPGQLSAMVPMVAVPEELAAVHAALARAREAVGSDAPLPLGMMVEVPAAALDGARFGDAEFFSIGTNDLTQYTMAAERGNAGVAELLRGLRPPVLELVRRTVAAAAGRPVAVCGELAGDPAAIAELLRAGVRELSMAPALIPEAKAAVRALHLGAS